MSKAPELTITDLARMGGRARAAQLSREEHIERGRAMADTRWGRMTTEERSAATEAARIASAAARKARKRKK